jgi:hypothetical protein
MCDGCAQHNVLHRGGKFVTQTIDWTVI